MCVAVGTFEAEDQHMLGEPAFLARLITGDTQGMALLAEQCIATIARADTLNREFLGEMHDETTIGVEIAC